MVYKLAMKTSIPYGQSQIEMKGIVKDNMCFNPRGIILWCYRRIIFK